jgi:DNA-binding transcriptional LysR family regulator
VLWPAIRRVMAAYPDIGVELSIDGTLTDIVADRFDAGVRLGEQVDKDMIAVRIGPDMRMAVVGSPAYFSQHPRPETPHDLTGHDCINLRMPTLGGLYAWEFGKDGRELNVRVEGRTTFNNMAVVVQAALDGVGLACVLEEEVLAPVKAGKLVRVLEDWSPPFAGSHLYYPSRRQLSPAFALIVDALRYRPR